MAVITGNSGPVTLAVSESLVVERFGVVNIINPAPTAIQAGGSNDMIINGWVETDGLLTMNSPGGGHHLTIGDTGMVLGPQDTIRFDAGGNTIVNSGIIIANNL